MREILFRGKCFHTEEWVEGYLGIEVPDELVIQQFSYDEYFKSNCIDQYSVKPETIGQYTGLTDKNGVKIFEGDIVHWKKVPYFVRWDFKKAEFVFANDMDADYFVAGFNEHTTMKFCEVIGNIHDNPELLKSLAEMKELDYELWIRTNGYSYLTKKQWDWLINNFQEQALNKVPNTNPKQMTGRWIPNKHTDTVLCSQCGKCYGDEYNYCPNCGAIMGNRQ